MMRTFNMNLQTDNKKELEHKKDIERQEAQNNYYDTL